jgi:hypothetical protein
MLIVAKKYLSGSAEDQSLTQGTAGNVADSVSEEAICRFGAPVNVVIDRGPENKKWTDQLLKRYHIRKLTITHYHAAANGVLK